ncbi:MAG: hypothetical protein QOG91_543 [Candidatus Parcubacteria bacterium]|nr:hypothetical protein [Candidatus Parcubacteria bacterium]
MNEPAFSGFSGYRHKQHHELPERGPSAIPGKSTKWCPHCEKEGKKTARRRVYTLNGPLRRSQCETGLGVRHARVSSLDAWWNRGIVRWLIAPPDPPTDYPWFEKKVCAICPRHGREEITHLNGIRQFGRARLWVIWFRATVSRSLEWIKPTDY